MTFHLKHRFISSPGQLLQGTDHLDSLQHLLGIDLPHQPCHGIDRCCCCCCFGSGMLVGVEELGTASCQASRWVLSFGCSDTVLRLQLPLVLQLVLLKCLLDRRDLRLDQSLGKDLFLFLLLLFLQVDLDMLAGNKGLITWLDVKQGNENNTSQGNNNVKYKRTTTSTTLTATTSTAETTTTTKTTRNKKQK